MMTNDNLFPTIEQEVKRATEELAEIRGQIKEFLAKLTLIEKRLQVAAPVKKNKPTPKKAEVEQLEGSLLADYNNLLAKYQANDENVLVELKAMGKDELYALAKYAGCKATKSTKKDVLTGLILGKLRESKLLRSGIE